MRCFTVNWEVKNFSVLLSKSDVHINSPDFKMMTSEGSVWAHILLWHPSLELFKFKYGITKGNLELGRFEVSIISSSDEIPVPEQTRYTISTNTILGNNSASLLHDDTLTVCCRMWAAMETGETRIRTFFYRDNFIWNIENFNPYSCYNDTLIEKDNFLYCMFLKRNADERTHTFQVEALPNISGCLSFVYFSPWINIQRGQITEKPSYSSITKQWEFEIFARNNTTSNLQIELQTIYVVHKEIQDRPTSPVSVKKGNTLKAVIGSSGTLNEDLLHLYREALHSDATLKAEGRSFPVHKSILSTRSEVFRAMFEKDKMKEGREGVVVIDDVDGETVNRMLVFLYGDLLEDINWEEASALYYAADKYDILPMKQKCADIMKGGLSVSNACDALVLADKHSDQDLMKSAVDFILDHKEVISSPKWEKLEESNSRLTTKIMKEILLKKWGK